jgi:hypothetical protein
MVLPVLESIRNSMKTRETIWIIQFEPASFVIEE